MTLFYPMLPRIFNPWLTNVHAYAESSRSSRGYTKRRADDSCVSTKQPLEFLHQRRHVLLSLRRVFLFRRLSSGLFAHLADDPADSKP